ncbi:AAA family ATPase (plasmid) [Cupriavidus sp. P-10]|uniref:ATP-dependent nuclease n=1 Tax=Cupriavidus sp. P-10 TaxID=2027911 RepID=UPI000E2F0602|nr:AAA family ATPase [Cupriavidus sp. P-10]BDB29226.1 AAA family ATPase [Cupriavidus sp. P-10]
MYISKIHIENFRRFGAGDDAFELSLNPGLTALVGENDAGKTAIIDALRLVIGTRDQESLRLDSTDFHQSPAGARAKDIRIQLTFSALTPSDRAAFAEYLTYHEDGLAEPRLIVTWIARRTEGGVGLRKYLPVEWRTGAIGDGPSLDSEARFQLQATYLRPLRDAERAMSAGRGSRLSQILQHTKEIKDGIEFDVQVLHTLKPEDLSVLGVGDYTNYLIETSRGVTVTRQRLNDDYLRHLSFSGDTLNARVRINGHRDDSTRLRTLLEKLEVALGSNDLSEDAHSRGLGSNNVLFMACELLLLGTEEDGFPLLIIEEPEAHLHPQRQLRLMGFLADQASRERPDGQQIQVILTTHSPNLASHVKLDNLVLVRDGRAYPMGEGQTKLERTDYRFLQRFLDVTKANLFFARGVVIVEGDAENILLPTLARLVGRDFERFGVSVVNVGGVGLSRYGRIFMRRNPGISRELKVPVACITDMDVMPDCAPQIVGKIEVGATIPKLPGSKRRWRVKSDFLPGGLESRRHKIRDKAQEQQVRTFVADEWTLEYDLAYFGLEKELWLAAALADADDKLNEKKTTPFRVMWVALHAYEKIASLSQEERCSHVYEPFARSGGVSKAIAAQYLAELLESSVRRDEKERARLLWRLPQYIRDAIAHVTEPFEPLPMSTPEAKAADNALDDASGPAMTQGADHA